jgi:uncharacterized DUF497 family protein
VKRDFRWNAWNVEHIAEHGVSPMEAEYIVNHVRPPFPEAKGDGKFMVAGQTWNGTYLRVAFIIDPEGTLFVIHAQPLTEQDKRIYRRRKR